MLTSVEEPVNPCISTVRADFPLYAVTLNGQHHASTYNMLTDLLCELH